MTSQIAQLSSQLTPILQSNGVIFAGLFGSQAEGTAHENSDYDFLVEFSPKKKYTLFRVAGLKQDLEQALNSEKNTRPFLGQRRLA